MGFVGFRCAWTSQLLRITSCKPIIRGLWAFGRSRRSRKGVVEKTTILLYLGGLGIQHLGASIGSYIFEILPYCAVFQVNPTP